MKPGPWPSIAKPVSKLRPIKIPVPRCAHSCLPAFLRKPQCPLRAFVPLCETKSPAPSRKARPSTAQRGKTNLDEGECMVSWVEVSGRISQNTAPYGQAGISSPRRRSSQRDEIIQPGVTAFLSRAKSPQSLPEPPQSFSKEEITFFLPVTNITPATKRIAPSSYS